MIQPCGDLPKTPFLLKSCQAAKVLCANKLRETLQIISRTALEVAVPSRPIRDVSDVFLWGLGPGAALEHDV